MNKLTCFCSPRADGVSAEDLRRLFPEPSITGPLLSLLQESKVDGFNLRSIIVLKDDLPVLLLPLFETRFDLSTFAEGPLRGLLKVAGRLIPSVFRPRVLSVGSVAGEWSEIGIDPNIDERTLDAAYRMAFSAMQTLASELKSDIMGLYNFNDYGKLPGEVFNKFNRVQYRSCAMLPINFQSIDEYLGRLSRAARKDMRRKMRVAPQVRVIRSRAVSPYLDRIYKLYLDTVTRGSMALGAHTRLFFEKVCERVPDAEFMLYFVEDELVAFNLLIVQQEAMTDIFFCMDQGTGRKYNLYVLSWLENIRACLERKILLYYTGQGTEKTKAHLGATFIPSFILFKHRWPVFDRLLFWQTAVTNKVLSYLGFWPDVPTSNAAVQKGELEIHDQRC